MNYSLNDFRAEFPDLHDRAFFNHAAEAPLPLRTRRVLAEYIRKKGDPSVFKVKDYFDLPQRTRQAVASLLKVGVKDVSLASCVTYAVNLAAQGLPLKEGDEVILVRGQFPANVYPWLQVEKTRGIKIRWIEYNQKKGFLDAEDLTPALSKRTKVFAFSLVHFASGLRADTVSIGALCRERGVTTVLDATQGAGVLDFDLSKLDIAAGSCHKWLMSPVGTGYMVTTPAIRTIIKTPFAGWFPFLKSVGFGDLTDYDLSPPDDGRQYEIGSPVMDHLAAQTESLKMLTDFGIANIEAHVKSLFEPLKAFLKEKDIPFIGTEDSSKASCILCFCPPDPAIVHRALLKNGIICVVREGNIRFSPHGYNTPDEMEKAIQVIGDSL